MWWLGSLCPFLKTWWAQSSGGLCTSTGDKGDTDLEPGDGCTEELGKMLQPCVQVKGLLGGWPKTEAAAAPGHSRA